MAENLLAIDVGTQSNPRHVVSIRAVTLAGQKQGGRLNLYYSDRAGIGRAEAAGLLGSGLPGLPGVVADARGKKESIAAVALTTQRRHDQRGS